MQRLLIALLPALIALPAAGFADDKHFVNTDVFQLELAADPRISPDVRR